MPIGLPLLLSDMPQKNQKQMTSTELSTVTLSSLRQNSDLWFRIQALLYDLSSVGSDPSSEKRLSATTNELYIGTPYFTDCEAAQIRSTLVQIRFPVETTDTGSKNICPSTKNDSANISIEHMIHKDLTSFFNKRRASGDARRCGPHDLLPIFLKIFEIEKIDLTCEKFRGRLKRSGLRDIMTTEAKTTDERILEIRKKSKKSR